MWALSFLIGILLANGLMAEIEEEIQECVDASDVGSLEYLPKVKEHELKTVCPKFLSLLDCVDDVVENSLGFRMADLVKMRVGGNVAKAANLFVNSRNTIEELCTTGTSLNNAYNKNAECLDNFDMDESDCVSNSADVYETYKKFEDTVQEAAGDNERIDDRDCMIQAYTVACLGAQIHEACGQSAFEFFQTFIKRTTIFSNAICTGRQLNTVKTKFLDSLELEGNERQIYKLAFDLRKRRK